MKQVFPIDRLVVAFVMFLAGFFCTLQAQGDDYIHYSLGVKYENEGRYNEALDEYRKVLVAYPDHYNAYMHIAQIQRTQKQPRLAIFNLKQALNYNPGWGKAHKMLSMVYEEDGQYQKAIMELQLFEQTCDPSEREAIQRQIDVLIRKVEGTYKPGDTASAPKAEVDSEGEPEKSKTVVKKSIASPDKPRTTRTAPAVAPQETKNPDAEAAFTLGKNLFNEGKFEEALEAFKRTISYERGHKGAYYYGGLIRRRNGEYDKAEINFKKAEGYRDKVQFYLGEIYGEQKRYGDAIEELTLFIRATDDAKARENAQQLLNHYARLMGKTLVAADRKAIQDSLHEIMSVEVDTADPQEPVRIIPDQVVPSYELRIDSMLSMEIVDTLTDAGQGMLMGAREFLAGRFDNAITSFKKILVASPTGDVAVCCLYNIGVSYMKLRLFPKAENQFQQILDRYPSHRLAPKALFFKALSYSERGEQKIAEQLFREFLQKHRNHAWAGRAYEKLGDIYTDLEQKKKAVDAYAQAVAQSANTADKVYALYKSGVSYCAIDNPARGMESFEKVIAAGEGGGMYVRVPDSYFKIADYYYQQKNYKTALDYYTRVTRKYPSYQETPWGLFQMGNIYRNLKEYEKAINTFKQLVSAYPDDYWTRQAQWKIEDTIWEYKYRSAVK